MKKVIIIILNTIVLIAVGCGHERQTRTAIKNSEKKKQNTLLQISEKAEIQEEWSFVISPPKVGLISTKNYISEISDLLPTNYYMVKDSTLWNDEYEDKDKWEYTVHHAVRRDNKTIFEIYPDVANKEKIFSIVILSSEYKIKDTEIRVGSTFGTLKKSFSIKDISHSYDFGLYIYCNGFDGIFSIDLKEEWNDSPEELKLSDSRKIETIVVY